MQVTQKTRVRFLGQEESLEEEMVTASSIIAWKIPWTEEPGGLHTRGHRVGHNWATNTPPLQKLLRGPTQLCIAFW